MTSRQSASIVVLGFFNGAIYFIQRLRAYGGSKKHHHEGELRFVVRRGSWSRVVWRSVDFIPMKFYGVPSCLALGVGALSAGARARFSAAPPRGPPGRRVQVAHFPVDFLHADRRRATKYGAVAPPLPFG